MMSRSHPSISRLSDRCQHWIVQLLVVAFAFQASVTNLHAAPPPGDRLLFFIGSNTLGEKAVPALAKAYLERVKKATDIVTQAQGDIIFISGKLPEGQQVYIEVHATGSGDAFRSFLGTYPGSYERCDIGMSSRRIRWSEVDDIEEKTGSILGDRGREPGTGCEHPVAMDGISIFVNNDNPLSRISFSELRDIYSREKTDWSDLREWPESAGSRPIHPIRRKEPSGTLDFFIESIKPDIRAIRDPRSIAAYVSSQEVIAQVPKRPGSIGFAGHSLVIPPGVKPLQVYNDNSDPDKAVAAARAAYPDATAIRDLSYPLARVVYFYTTLLRINPEVTPFIQFALSSSGQSVLATEGGLIRVEGTPDHITPAQVEIAEKPAPAPETTKGGSGRKIKNILRLHGSNTIGYACAVNLAHVYLAKKRTVSPEQSPIEDLAVNVNTPEGEPARNHDVMCDINGDGVWENIEIRPSGSSDAFRALNNGWCDVGMSSRPISPAEARDLINICGDLSVPRAQMALGVDALAIVTHPSRAIKQMTLDQVTQVFLGTLTDWAALGSTAGPIHVHSRPERSGTYRYFCDSLLAGRSILGSAKRHAENTEVANAVAADPSGIGFVPYYAASVARPVQVGESAVTGFAPPTHASVRSASYPSLLCRHVYLYVPEEKPRSVTVESRTNWETAREFADLSQSWIGQVVVADSGFITEISFEDRDGQLKRKTNETNAAYAQRLVGIERGITERRLSLRPVLADGAVTARLLFDASRFKVAAESHNLLTVKLPSWLKLFAGASNGFVAEGWTDDLADEATSIKDSERRAKVVAQEVITATGLPCAVMAKGKSLKPANTSEENKRLNRCVILKFAPVPRR